jgi:hypothetical protein
LSSWQKACKGIVWGKMNKAPLWNKFSTWQEAENVWDQGAKDAREKNPLKILKTLPSMPGISVDTAQHLKWKSLKWMVQKDENWTVTKHILKKPFIHGWRYLKSLFKKKSYIRDGDFFLYGVQSIDDFKAQCSDPNSLLVVGFSYCEKPHECPSGRFTPDCISDPNNLICRQCFIGKAINTLPENRAISLLIPTIHYIGTKIFEIIEAHPKKRILFMITACELTLEMFGDFGNLAGIEGIGVRLDGRICNTMKAFELSENGIKPGLTVVLPVTERRILDILSHFRSTTLQDAKG